MCGIFGITSTSENIVPLLLKNLKYLAYRGYDSTGICLATNPFLIHKTMGSVDLLNADILSEHALSGIGHTRWATHGKKSIENAHPHTSKGVSIVHNGIIQNHNELRSMLTLAGYQFKSETDSEVIAHLLHQQIQHHPAIIALENVKNKLEGRYAFIAVIESEPNMIFGLTSNLSLLIGHNNHSFSIASDLIALKHCDQYIKIPFNTPFYISNTTTSLPQNFMPLPIMPSEVLIEKNITYHEIKSQHTIPNLFAIWHELPIEKPEHVLFIACGSSFHCAQLAHYWFIEQGIYTTLETASELKNRTFQKLDKTLIIAISQSGETADTLICMESLLTEPHLHSIAITNTPTSSLASLCQTIIPLNIGVERGVASTKAVTAQMLILFNIAKQFSDQPTKTPILELSSAISVLYNLTSIPYQAALLSQYQHILCLGKHTLLPIAHECALKIKELSYIHAESMPMGELKHGPLALIDHRFCTIVLSSNCISTQTCISEIKARGGNVIQIGSHPSCEIQIPYIPEYNHILVNIACQLLSYHIAKALNRPIDQPRNLAKSVTVE